MPQLWYVCAIYSGWLDIHTLQHPTETCTLQTSWKREHRDSCVLRHGSDLMKAKLGTNSDRSQVPPHVRGHPSVMAYHQQPPPSYRLCDGRTDGREERILLRPGSFCLQSLLQCTTPASHFLKDVAMSQLKYTKAKQFPKKNRQSSWSVVCGEEIGIVRTWRKCTMLAILMFSRFNKKT